MVAVLAVGRARGRTDAEATSRRTFLVSLGLAGLFTVGALGLWFATQDETRVYYGTDARAPSILIGAALGAFLVWRGPARSARMRRAVEVAAIVGALVILGAWLRLSGVNVYRGGLLVCALAGAAVIASAAHPEPGPVARVLGFGPLVGLGLISYGVYLYHWPIYLWLDEGRTGLDGWPLFGLRLAVTLAVALASYRFVEQPIRRGAFPARTLRWLTPLAAGALIVTMVIATLGYRSPDAAGDAGITDAHTAARAARRHPGATRLLVVGNSVAYYLGGEGFSRLHTGRGSSPSTAGFPRASSRRPSGCGSRPTARESGPGRATVTGGPAPGSSGPISRWSRSVTPAPARCVTTGAGSARATGATGPGTSARSGAGSVSSGPSGPGSC